METINIHGVTIPALGFGTSRMTGETCESAVIQALDIGYRHIDTAQMYENEAAVGTAIAASSVPRDSVFVTTKINRGNMDYDSVLSSTNESLNQLEMNVIDLLLIHAPSQKIPVSETIDAMNTLQSDGKVQHIGVSNFSVPQTQAAINASDTPIITDQVKYNPYHNQDKLVDFCSENDILLTAYTPLAKGDVGSDKHLNIIGDRYGKTAAQVTLRWLVQQPNVSPIPKAAKTQHMQENYNIFDFDLTEDEMETISNLS